ncbi:MAG: hypothetical protein WC789_02990 [Lentisphaeria bacterium]
MKNPFPALFKRPPPPLPAAQRNQRGIALLLTLGVLALLILLAMAFAFSTRTERAAASVNADLVKARLLAESGLARVTSSLQNQFKAGADYVHLYPASSGFVPLDSNGDGSFEVNVADTAWNGRRYLPSISDDKDQTQVTPALHVPFTTTLDFTPATTLLPDTGWTHVKDSGGKLVGRYLYLAIDASGMFDPNTAVSRTQDEGFGDEPDFNLPEHIQLAPLPGIAAGFAKKLRDDDLTNGKRPGPATDKKAWLCLFDIAKKTDPASGAEWDAVRNALHPVSRSITETWRETPLAADQPRFDLSTLAGGGATLAAVKSGIPWLASLQPASTQDQVAANLIDYCDPDDAATTDFSGSVAAGDATATYVGLEQAAYINEFSATATLTSVENPVGSGNYDNKLDVSVTVELVNIYDTAFSGGILEIGFDYVNMPAGATPVAPATLPRQTHTFNPVACNAHGYNTDNTPAFTFNLPQTVGIHPGILIFNLTNIQATLKNGGGNLLDFANIGDMAPQAVTPGPGVGYNKSVADPRCNLDPSQWDPLPVNSNGAKNGNADPSGKLVDGGDTETTTDPAVNLSTAYIRNDTPTSLWELGAIHRGAPWQTLRLSKFHPSSGTYADGDAAILDQVKLTNAADSRGRFNVNSAQEDAWITFLRNVPVRTTTAYADARPAAAADYLDEAGASTLAKKIITATSGMAAGKPRVFFRRGQLATIPALSDGSVFTQDTDRLRELLVGRLATLAEPSPHNWFYVIVTAQAVKDLRDQDAAITALPPASRQRNWKEYSDGGTTHWCALLAEQKILALLYRDARTNRFKIEWYEYLND